MKKLLLSSVAALSLVGATLPAVSAAVTLSDGTVLETTTDFGKLTNEKTLFYATELNGQYTTAVADFKATLAAAEAADAKLEGLLAAETDAKAELKKAQDEHAAAVAAVKEAEAKVAELEKLYAEFVEKTAALVNEANAAYNNAVTAANAQRNAAVGAVQGELDTLSASLPGLEAKAGEDQAALDATVAAGSEQSEIDAATATRDASAKVVENTRQAILDTNSKLAEVTAAADATLADDLATAKAILDGKLATIESDFFADRQAYKQLSDFTTLDNALSQAQTDLATAKADEAAKKSVLPALELAVTEATKAVRFGKIEHQAALAKHKNAALKKVELEVLIAKVLANKAAVGALPEALIKDLEKSNQSGKTLEQLEADRKQAEAEAAAAQKAADELNKLHQEGSTSETTKSESETTKSETTKAANTTAKPAAAPAKKSTLPNTGETTTLATLALATLSVVAGAFAIAPKFKKN